MSEEEIKRIFEERLKDFIQHCCVYNDNGDMVMKREKVKSWFGITDER